MAGGVPHGGGSTRHRPTRYCAGLRHWFRQGIVKIGQEAVSHPRSGQPERHDRYVIEDLLAAVIGLALLAYLGYALARPERF